MLRKELFALELAEESIKTKTRTNFFTAHLLVECRVDCGSS